MDIVYPTEDELKQHLVVSHEEWVAARKKLLEKEKELARLRDELNVQRMALPWERVEKDYAFETPEGRKTLADLFRGRSQLFVYHFMLAPGSTDPCSGCSFISDHVDGARLHFEHHDLAFVAVSRAQVPEIEAVKKRMGWKFPWVSSQGSDFNYDYNVSFTPEQIAAGEAVYNYEPCDYGMEDLHGISVFYKNAEGEIFHTYSSYARGGEIFLGAYHFLDVSPKGRNESEIMDWVRLHDCYEDAAEKSSCCH